MPDVNHSRSISSQVPQFQVVATMALMMSSRAEPRPDVRTRKRDVVLSPTA